MKMFDREHRMLPIAAALLILAALVEIVLAGGPDDQHASRYSNVQQLDGGAGPCAGGADRFDPAYVPGVDVHGNRVVPADTLYSGGPSGVVPEPYFRIYRRVHGLPARRRAVALGEVGVDPATGLVTFNGVPLNAPRDAYARCADGLAGARAVPGLK